MIGLDLYDDAPDTLEKKRRSDERRRDGMDAARKEILLEARGHGTGSLRSKGRPVYRGDRKRARRYH
jgi:hypothetical protein